MKPVMGVIGLGIMGGAMAEVLLEAGYQVSGFDPKPAALRRLKKAGGTVLSSAAAVAEQSDVVIVSLATARALSVVVAELAAARPKRKPIIIETSTLPIADKDAAAAALANAGMRTLDCPISGTASSRGHGLSSSVATPPLRARPKIFLPSSPVMRRMSARSVTACAGSSLPIIWWRSTTSQWPNR